MGEFLNKVLGVNDQTIPDKEFKNPFTLGETIQMRNMTGKTIRAGDICTVNMGGNDDDILSRILARLEAIEEKVDLLIKANQIRDLKEELESLTRVHVH